jgi:hypothetical protein
MRFPSCFRYRDQALPIRQPGILPCAKDYLELIRVNHFFNKPRLWAAIPCAVWHSFRQEVFHRFASKPGYGGQVPLAHPAGAAPPRHGLRGDFAGFSKIRSR